MKSESRSSDGERRIVMVKKPINLFKRIFTPAPSVPSNHIYNLFGVKTSFIADNNNQLKIDRES